MLYYETLEPATLELLNELMKIDFFNGLRLVGGTSLALQIGHRKSIDIDLFGNIEPEEISIYAAISKFKEIKLLKRTPNIFVYHINGVKVDIVNYQYKWIQPEILIDNIRLADERDIAAMKLAAISGRGTKKDFIDLFFLLKKYNLKQLLDFYKEKFPDGSEFIVLKSLSYFEDAEDEEVIMIENYEWKDVKNSIKEALDQYLKMPE